MACLKPLHREALYSRNTVLMPLNAKKIFLSHRWEIQARKDYVDQNEVFTGFLGIKKIGDAKKITIDRFILNCKSHIVIFTAQL